jgi:HAD superfamily hydrolase (TIGR01509 family)
MVFIFDMDGVLVDNHKWHFEAWVEFGKKYGLEISAEDFSRQFGSTNHQVLVSLFGNVLSAEEIIALGNEKEGIYRQLYLPFIKPVDGLPEFLQYIYEIGIPIALATSAPPENVEFTLNGTGLKKYFSVITDSAMVTRGKPDPQVYLFTAAKLGVEPADCIVFEDSVAGIKSATRAGMRVIAVATTHKPEELLMYSNEIIMNFDASKEVGLEAGKSLKQISNANEETNYFSPEHYFNLYGSAR